MPDRDQQLPPIAVDDLRAHADLGLTAVGGRRLERRMERRTRRALGRAAGRGPRPSSLRLLSRRTRVIVAAVVAAFTLSSAAVAALVATRESAPLRGPFSPPGASVPHPGAAYRFTVRPNLSVGSVGWCVVITLSDHGTPGGGGADCGSARTTADPVLDAGDLSTFDRRGDPRSERQIAYAIVDHRIAAGRRGGDGVVVTARSDHRLPTGWRSIVVVQAGAHGIGYLGPDGRPVRRLTDTEQGAARIEDQPRRRIGPSALARLEGCGLAPAPGSPVRIAGGRALLRAPRPAPHVNGRAFLSCSSARVVSGRDRFVATVLLDAAAPGVDRPDALPGAVPRGTGDVELEGSAQAGPALARRVGRAWIVVQGSDAVGRARVLHDLSIPTPTGR